MLITKQGHRKLLLINNEVVEKSIIITRCDYFSKTKLITEGYEETIYGKRFIKDMSITIPRPPRQDVNIFGPLEPISNLNIEPVYATVEILYV